ncbi:MAG: AAA family ATPase [Candidatus Baltobacteraceae bacterium]
MDLDPGLFFSAGKLTLRWIAPTWSDAATILAAAGDPSSADATSLELFAGEFLPGDYEEWVVDQRQRIDCAIEKILAHRVAQRGDASAAQRLLAYDPYHSSAYELLLQTEADAGRLASVRTLVERARTAFEETGNGLPENLRRFELLAAAAAVGSLRFRLPFVGRQAEIAQLCTWLDDDAGRPLFIIGPAGIGKSTLLMRSGALALERGLHVMRLQAVENDVRSLGAWQELYERLTGEEFTEFSGLHSGDLAAAVAASILEHLDDANCLLLDDAQHLQGDAIEVLRLLLASREPLRIISSVRSEAASRLADQLKAPSPQEITLGVLAADDFRESMSASLKDNASRVVAEAIYARTGGHPLFLASLIEQLVQEGAILGDQGVWEVKKTATLDAIPKTVRRFVEMRLRSCGNAACEVAAALALDPDAAPAQLKDVLGMQEDTFLDALDDLLASEILVEPDTGPIFAFRHDIEREVAEGSLNAARRARLHERFAALLEPFQNRGNALRRSRHFRAARRWREAAEQCLVAAEEALEWNAWRDVIRIACEGIDLLRELARSPEADALASNLHRGCAHGYLMGGYYEDAIRTLVEAARCGYCSSDPALGRRADQVYAIACLYAHKYADAQKKADEIIETASKDGREGPLPMAWTSRSCASFFLNEPDVAVGDAGRAIEIAKRTGRKDSMAGAYRYLVQWNGMLWRFPEAMSARHEAMEISTHVNFQSEMSSRCLSGWLEFLLERYASCIAMMRGVQRGVRQGPELQRTMNKVSSTMLPRLLNDAMVMEAWAHLRTGTVDEAAELLDRVASNSAAYAFPEHVQLVALLRAELQLARGAHAPEDFEEMLSVFDAKLFLREEIAALSHTVSLIAARIACRTRSAGAAAAWDSAFDEAREIAARTPLDAPWVFRKLEQAAREASQATRQDRAATEAAAWESRKVAALAGLRAPQNLILS